MHGAAATGNPAAAHPAVGPPKGDARVAVAGITLLLHYSPADVPAVTGCAATASFSPSAPGQQDVPAGKAVQDELPPGPAANAATGGDDTDDEAYADATESLHSSAALRQSPGLGASAASASGCGFPASPAALGGFGSDSVMFHSAAAAYDAAAAASAATTEDASEAATSRSVPEATAATDAAAAPAAAPEHMPISQCEQPAGFFSRTAAASGVDGSAASLEGSHGSAAGDGHHGSSPTGCGCLEVECSDVLIDASGGGDRDHTVAVRIYAISALERLPPAADTTR